MATERPLSIGIVGGMSPESTVTYYQHIVRRHQEEFHNHAYPRMVIASVSFQNIIDWQQAGAWDRIAAEIEKEFKAVAAAGADFALMACNTQHKILPDISCPIPILSIYDVIVQEAERRGITRLGLTGTQYVMAGGFYAEELEAHGLKVILPSPEEQETINGIIYDDLIFGRVPEQATQAFGDIAQALTGRGAEAVLLACTELELLTRQRVFSAPMLDTARLHAESAWRQAIAPSSMP